MYDAFKELHSFKIGFDLIGWQERAIQRLNGYFISFEERQQTRSLHHVWHSFSQVCYLFIRCVCVRVCVVGEAQKKTQQRWQGNERQR